MPDTMFLHIQTREHATVRVQELSGVSIRIGRAATCEVRLADSELAEVQCLLRRRGRDWHIQPVGPPGRLAIDGRPVEHQRPLPVGVPLRVGEAWLTLRPSDRIAPAFGSYERPIPVEPVPAPKPEAPPIGPEPLHGRDYDDPTRVVGPAPSVEAVDPLPPSDWHARHESQVRRLRDRERERHWQAKWRAVGERLRGASARPQEPPPRPEPVRPASTFSAAGYAPRPQARPLKPAGPPPAPEPARSEAVPERPIEAPPIAQAVPSPTVVSEPAAELARPDPPIPPRWLCLPAPEAGATEDLPAAELDRLSAPSPPVEGLLQAGPSEEPGPHSLASSPLVGEGWGEGAPLQPPGDPLTESLPRQEGGDQMDRPDACLGTPEVADPHPTEGFAGTCDRLAEAESAAPRPAMPTSIGVSWTPPPPPRTPPLSPEFDPEIPSPPDLESDLIPREAPAPDPSGPTDPFVADTAHGTSWSWSNPTTDWRFATPPITPEVDQSDEGESWPSIRDILAQAGASGRPEPARSPPSRPRPARAPEPTVGRPPGSLALPGWIALPALAAALLVLGTAGLGLSWIWSQDDRAAGLVADYLLGGPRLPARPLRVKQAPGLSWWKTTARHLYLHAVAVGRDPSRPGRDAGARALLFAARSATPLEPAVRLALAGPGGDAAGLSRDVIALRRTGRSLLAKGQTEPALRIYREALEMITGADPRRSGAPGFVEDANVQRFAMPDEDLVHDLLADLADAGPTPLAFARWSRALPPSAVVRLAAYRLLRERGSPDADRAFELVSQGAGDPAPGAAGAVERAATAEALALRGRLDEAAARYRNAIDAMPDGPVRRSWFLNLADIEGRRGRVEAMREAWDAARGADPHDPVNVRLAEARQRQGSLAGPRAIRPEDRLDPRRDERVLPARLDPDARVAGGQEVAK